jgi:hypothetical protein
MYAFLGEAVTFLGEMSPEDALRIVDALTRAHDGELREEDLPAEAPSRFRTWLLDGVRKYGSRVLGALLLLLIQQQCDAAALRGVEDRLHSRIDELMERDEGNRILIDGELERLAELVSTLITEEPRGQGGPRP